MRKGRVAVVIYTITLFFMCENALFFYSLVPLFTQEVFFQRI